MMQDPAHLAVEERVYVVDEEVDIRLVELCPHAPVTLSAALFMGRNLFIGLGHFVADANGEVHTSRDASLGGSWRGRQSMGLFSNLQPLPSKNAGARVLVAGSAETILKYDIRAWRGHLDWNEVATLLLPFEFFGTKGTLSAYYDRHFLARTEIQRTYLGPDVKRRLVKLVLQNRRYDGTLFIPAGEGPFPAAIDLFGGIGGKVELRAALLARRGIMTLAVSYLGNADIGLLTSTDFTMDYFDPIIRQLYEHPLTDRSSGGIGFIGALHPANAIHRDMVFEACAWVPKSAWLAYSAETPLAAVTTSTLQDWGGREDTHYEGHIEAFELAVNHLKKHLSHQVPTAAKL